MKPSKTEKNAQLIYNLMGLGMGGAVLHIGAHPDDEDIGLLSYLSCKFGVKAIYWSANRGEGGQNRIGPYRDEALGVYRTWESLAARAEDRSECLFGPFYDYGYSKNAKEAEAKWGEERLVKEIVRAIRITQPHIIVARWKGTSGDYHGQHQAVGRATLKAFETAGDPEQFPELKAQGVAAWQPLKYYHSMDNSGGDLTAGGAGNFSGRINPAYEKDGILRINTGEFDPIAGRTYQERAWLAYNKHQTQAMGLAPAPGDFFYYFSLHKSLVPVPNRETSIFNGLDPSLTGLADHPGNGPPFLRKYLDEIKTKASEALRQFRANDPMHASSSILEAIALLRQLRADLAQTGLSGENLRAIDIYLGCKIKDFEEVAAKCLGLEIEFLSERSRIIPGHQFAVSASLWNHREIQIDKAVFSLSLPDKWEAMEMESDSGSGNLLHQSKDILGTARHFTKNFKITADEMANLTCPYWLVKPRENYVYNWPEGEPCSRPFGPSPVNVECQVEVGHHTITLKEEVVCRESFPGGFRELPLAVIPPISLHPKTSTEFLQAENQEHQIELQVVVRNNSEKSIEGSLELVLPPEWSVDPERMDITLAKAGDTKTAQHTVTVPPDYQAGRYRIQYRIRCGERDYTVVVNPVRMGVPGIPTAADESTCIKEELILKPSEVMVHILDVQFVKDLTLAYVQGAKEELLETLKPFGINFHLIKDEEMGYLELNNFDVIVIGPNAYLTRDELRKYASRFLEYVENGGTLIVQFQGYRYQTPGFTPYPFKYNQPHDRVTNQDAPINILDPDHLLFRIPNIVNAKDFDNWVRERGLYFFGEWDKRYHTIISCFDPGEDPKEGGLIDCQYGKGTFLYTGYSFFRQLPAGITGAFRLFANILAIPQARILERIEFLKKISLFSLLTEEQLDAVARLMSERWVNNGQYICRQGEEGDELYIVYHGEIEVIMESGGQKKILTVFNEGECLGEMAVIGSIPRTASLRARGDLQLLVIKGPHFISLLRQHPDMSIQVMKILVQRLTSKE